MQLFSDFVRSEKHKLNYVFVWSIEWVKDELLGKKYPDEFFGILDSGNEKGTRKSGSRISTVYNISLIPKDLIKFIEELKFEIIIGQTHNDFK